MFLFVLFTKKLFYFLIFLCLISLPYRVVLVKKNNRMFRLDNFARRKSFCLLQSIRSLFFFISFKVKYHEPFKEMFLWTSTTKNTDKTVHHREDHIFAGPDLTSCFLQNYRVGSGFIKTFRWRNTQRIGFCLFQAFPN